MGAKKLSEKEEALYGEVHGVISSLVDDLEDQKHPSREFALAYTKLEEAEMWMQRAFERLGYEPVEDDGDDEEDEGEESGDEASESDGGDTSDEEE